MSATDLGVPRIVRAKEEAKKVVASMESGDAAMVVSFARTAKVESSYTGNRAVLRQVIDAIKPTQESTSLHKALEVAAGLANPSRQFSETEGSVATSISKPKLILLTDGGFADVEGFSIGNLEPTVVVIGSAPPPYNPAKHTPDAKESVERNPSDNVAVVALQTRRNEEKPDQLQVFGRVKNYRAEDVATEARLLKKDPDKPKAESVLIDAVELKIPAQSEQAFKFDLPDSGAAELEIRIDAKDALDIDNRAFTVVNKPRRAQVLIVSEGNKYLVDTLKTSTMVQLADFTEVKPKEYEAPELLQNVKSGKFDFVVYDGYRPKEAPEANTLYFGELPPGQIYDDGKTLDQPIILDWDLAHPVMQYIRDLSTVFVLKAKGVEPPPGTTTLIGSNLGPLAFIQPRNGYSDLVLTFGLLDGKNFNTNWPVKISFPLFLYNCMTVLGNVQDSAGEAVHAPGDPVALRADVMVPKVTVADPKGTETVVEKNTQGQFIYNKTEARGLYNATWGKDENQSFAVNLFDPRESDLATRGLAPEGTPKEREDDYRIKIGYNTVDKGGKTFEPTKIEWWPAVAMAALAVVLIEWYIYNKRVYI